MRATTDREDIALSNVAIPQMYTMDSWNIDPENPDNASNRTPRFRGLAYTGDLNASGTISTGQGDNLALNNNDFIIFRG